MHRITGLSDRQPSPCFATTAGAADRAEAADGNGRRVPTMGLSMRICLLLFAMLPVVSACGPESVLLTFDNRTTEPLCDYAYPEQIASASCLAEIAAQTQTKWGRDCDADATRPIRVIISIKRSRRAIYDRTASCGEWHKSKGRFVIEQVGGDFVVTASLPNPTPRP